MANLFNLFNSLPNQPHDPNLLESALSLAQLDPNFSAQQLNHFNPLFQSLPPSVLNKRPNQYELPNVPEKKTKPNPAIPQNQPQQSFNIPPGYESLFQFPGMPQQRQPQRPEQDLMGSGNFLAQQLANMKFGMGLYDDIYSRMGIPSGPKFGGQQELNNAILSRPELYSLLEGNNGLNGGFFNSQNPFAQLKEPQVQSYNPAMLLNMQNQPNLLAEQQRGLNPFMNLPKMQDPNTPNFDSFTDIKQMQQALRSLQQREGRPEFPPGMNPNALLQQNLTLQDPSMLSLQFLQGQEQGFQRELLERQFQNPNEKLQQQINNYNLLQNNPNQNGGPLGSQKPESYFQNPQLLQQMQAAGMQGFDPQDMNSLLKQYNKNALQQNQQHELNKRHNILTNINTEALPNNLSIPKKKPEEVMKQPMHLVDLKPTVQIQEEIHPKQRQNIVKEDFKNPISDAGSYDRETVSPSGFEYASTVATNDAKKKSEEINDNYFPTGGFEDDRFGSKKIVPKKKQPRQNEAPYAQVVVPVKQQERRKNRWQMAQEEKIKEDELILAESQQVYQQKIVNTTLGVNHQVRIPDMELNEFERLERHPRMKWAPDSVEENDWTDLTEKVEACLRQTVNEEKLIKMLQENEGNIQKVLEMLQRDPRKYSQAFAIKMRRPKMLP